MDFGKRAMEERDYIVSWRRRFHQHPELSHQEWDTTEALAGELEGLGIPVTRFPGRTGLVGTITGGRPGKTVLLRADIDALPIQEDTGLPFASQRKGVMHACGHDCHMAMLLGAAKLLQESREELGGTVRLLFQAAEETSHGAEDYMGLGCLEGVDAAFGMHIWATFRSPFLSVEPGPRMSACDNFHLTVRGKSAHGATPHLGCDGIAAAAACVTQLQGYTARRHDASRPLVITVGSIHGGERFNVLADTVTMAGTARYFDVAFMERLHRDLEALFSAACLPYGCTAGLTWEPFAPPVVNGDEALVETGRRAATALYGAEGLCHFDPLMVSEDFAYYGEKVPTLFCFLGGHDPAAGEATPHHTKDFRVDENALPRGAALYAQFAREFLG